MECFITYYRFSIDLSSSCLGSQLKSYLFEKSTPPEFFAEHADLFVGVCLFCCLLLFFGRCCWHRNLVLLSEFCAFSFRHEIALFCFSLKSTTGPQKQHENDRNCPFPSHLLVWIQTIVWRISCLSWLLVLMELARPPGLLAAFTLCKRETYYHFSIITTPCPKGENHRCNSLTPHPPKDRISWHAPITHHHLPLPPDSKTDR